MNRILLLILGLVIVLGGIGLNSALFTVHEREQALVIQFGEPREVIKEPGLHVKVPLIQNVVYFDKRVLDFDARTVEVPTLDQKQLIVDAFARYRIVDPLRYYQAVRTETNANARIEPIMQASLREMLGNVPMLRILTEERAKLMNEIEIIVNRQAQGLGVNIIDVRMKRVDLPEANSAPVLNRMQTQREQEARRIRAEGERDSLRIKAEADKQQRVIFAEARKTAEITRGEGDGEATRVYNEAFGQDPGFFDFWRTMQAMSKGLNEETTSYVGPPEGDFFRFFGDTTGQGGRQGAAGGSNAPIDSDRGPGGGTDVAPGAGSLDSGIGAGTAN